MPVFRVIESTHPDPALQYLAYDSHDEQPYDTPDLSVHLAHLASVQGTRTAEPAYWVWRPKQAQDAEAVRSQFQLFAEVAPELRNAGTLIIVPQVLIQLENTSDGTSAYATPHMPGRVQAVASEWLEAQVLDQVIRCAELLRALHRLGFAYTAWRVDDLRWHAGRMLCLPQAASLLPANDPQARQELPALGQLWHALLTGYQASDALDPYDDMQWRTARGRDERGTGIGSIGLRLLLTRLIAGHYRTLDEAGRALDIWRNDWLTRRLPPDPQDEDSIERLQDGLRVGRGRAQAILADLAWRLSGHEVDYRIRQTTLRQVTGEGTKPTIPNTNAEPSAQQSSNATPVRQRTMQAIETDVQQALRALLIDWSPQQPAPNFHHIRDVILEAEDDFEAGARLENFLDAMRPYRGLMRFIAQWRDLPPYTAASEASLLRQALPATLLDPLGSTLDDLVRMQIANYLREIEIIVEAGHMGQINDAWMYRQALNQPEVQQYLSATLRKRYDAVMPRLKNLYDFNAWFVDNRHKADDKEIINRALERGVPITGDTLRAHLERVIVQSDSVSDHTQATLERYRQHIDGVQRTLEDEVSRMAQQIERVKSDAAAQASTQAKMQTDSIDSRIKLLERYNRRYVSRRALFIFSLLIVLLLASGATAIALIGTSALNTATGNLTAVSGTLDRVFRQQSTQIAVFAVVEGTITAGAAAEAEGAFATANADSTLKALNTQQAMDAFTGTLDAESARASAQAAAGSTTNAALGTEAAQVRTQAASNSSNDSAAPQAQPTQVAAIATMQPLSTNTPAEPIDPTNTPVPTFTATSTPIPDTASLQATLIEAESLRDVKYARLPNLTETAYVLTFDVNANGVPLGLPTFERGSVLSEHMESYVLPALATLGANASLHMSVREQGDTRAVVMPMIALERPTTFGSVVLLRDSIILWRQNGERALFPVISMGFPTQSRLVLAQTDFILAIEEALGIRADFVRLPSLGDMVPVQINERGQVVAALLRDEYVSFMQSEVFLEAGAPGANVRISPSTNARVLGTITNENAGQTALPNGPGVEDAVGIYRGVLESDSLLRENRVAINSGNGLWYLVEVTSPQNQQEIGWVRRDTVRLRYANPQGGLPTSTPLMMLNP